MIYNATGEQMKLHAELATDGVTEKQPSGMIIYHNTFVSPLIALTDETPTTLHNLVMNNNIFVGPEQLATARTVEHTVNIDRGSFYYNGYSPDGGFWLGKVAGANVLADGFAALKSGGVFEQHGTLLDADVFANHEVGPLDPKIKYPPFDFALAATSAAIDKGAVLTGVNEGFHGAAPDLGAIELGCAPPTYGPRSEAESATEEEALIDCAKSSTSSGASGAGGAASSGSTSGSGGSPGGGVGAARHDDATRSSGCACSLPGKSSDPTPAGGLTVICLWAGLHLRSVGRKRRAI